MAFAAPQPNFPRNFNEARLSTVPNSPLYERRANRASVMDHSPGAANSVNSHSPSGKIDLTEKMGALEMAQAPPNSALNMPAQRQVKELVHVIEAAEYAIRNQMEENEHLRSALRVTEWELQNSKLDQQGVPRPTDDQAHDPYHSRQGGPRSGFERVGHFFPTPRAGGNREGYAVPGLPDEQSSIIIHPTAGQPQEYQNGGSLGPPLPGQHGHPNSAMNGSNGGTKSHHRGGLPHLPPIVDTNSSGVSSPSSRSMSPTHARRRDAELETRAQSSGQVLPQLPSDVNANHNLYQPSDVNDNHNVYHEQEVALRTTISQQEEITLLHKRLTEASIKEAQVQSEKRILERRVAELRLAYDQQQQGLVDAASKALSYRQEVLEENIRLTYALQAADTERSVYISNLLPLLAEFDLQPTVTDAHSMVSAIKILVQHLRSELNLSEMQGKNKDALFRQNWRTDLQYHNGGQYPQQSPPHGKLHGLEIVPQHFQPQMPASPPSPMRQSSTWPSATSSQFPAGGDERAQFGGSGQAHSSPPANHFQPTQFANQESHDNQDFERPSEFSEQDDPSSNGAVGGSEETERSDAAPRSPRSPHMPTLPEETTSEDGDPLPAIQGLQIVGHAELGGRLTACGHSINGTALCMFQWVRHYQNGTTMYIEGAAQPEYTVTADDCDTMIAIECVPMDERNRRGELVTVFANESRWITCDAMMQDQIDSYSAQGHVSFEVQFLVDGGPPEENWESVSLILKRNSFELRRNSTAKRVVLSEKYSTEVSIKIPVGHLIQCVITSHERRLFYLEFRDSRTRDVGVLTFRLLQKTALDGKRGRRRGGIPWFS